MKKNKKNSDKITKITMSIVTLGLIVALGIIFTGGKKGEVQSVEIKDGIQYIRIAAGGGYSPQVTEAKAGIPKNKWCL
jgi:plastocyanin domain-containing protein